MKVVVGVTAAAAAAAAAAAIGDWLRIRWFVERCFFGGDGGGGDGEEKLERTFEAAVRGRAICGAISSAVVKYVCCECFCVFLI